ncbi:RES family NAD+ phosphorylase [Ectothiorhodospiraceae bacterium WFHF3C12]|nr:RES family NAD+ phosphorylase [Ectothiorhodospiraceae bacterium WFHF3C12]
MEDIPVTRIEWRPSYRVVASRFPPVGVFDRVADPADLEAVYQLEAITNPRVRQEAGDISLVPPQERVTGPGSTPIMAAFTHLNPDGSRFSDGSFGVYYCARVEETAIRESVYHTERFLGLSDEPPIDVQKRVYCVDLQAQLHDIRGLGRERPQWYDPESYAGSQPLGMALRSAGATGVVYDSVRHGGGQCAGAFRPRALIPPARQSRHLALRWDGRRITEVLELRSTGVLLD